MTALDTAPLPPSELASRASLLVDGARLPLPTAASTLGVSEARLAYLVALGRLHAADDVVVLPKGCAPHLTGLVTGAPRTVLHVLGCAHCQLLEESLAAGVALARARWTGQAADAHTVRAGARRSAPRGVMGSDGSSCVPAPPGGATVAPAVPPPPVAPVQPDTAGTSPLLHTVPGLPLSDVTVMTFWWQPADHRTPPRSAVHRLRRWSVRTPRLWPVRTLRLR